MPRPTREHYEIVLKTVCREMGIPPVDVLFLSEGDLIVRLNELLIQADCVSMSVEELTADII